MSDSTHYVVTLSIERVDWTDSAKKPEAAQPRGFTAATTLVSQRVVTQLAHLVVRADELTEVANLTKQHIDLVSDISAVDPVQQRPKGNVR